MEIPMCRLFSMIQYMIYKHSLKIIQKKTGNKIILFGKKN